MWLWPVVAMGLTGSLVFFVTSFLRMPSMLLELVAQVCLSALLYGGILWIAEREQVRNGLALVSRLLRPMLERI